MEGEEFLPVKKSLYRWKVWICKTYLNSRGVLVPVVDTDKMICEWDVYDSLTHDWIADVPTSGVLVLWKGYNAPGSGFNPLRGEFHNGSDFYCPDDSIAVDESGNLIPGAIKLGFYVSNELWMNTRDAIILDHDPTVVLR